MFNHYDSDNPNSLLDALLKLRHQVLAQGTELFAAWRPGIRRRAFLPGAQNLAYYLALRQHDIRPLQKALIPLGLSSLGRAESRVLPNLDAVLASLGALCAKSVDELPPRPGARAFFRGSRMLEHHANRLLGPALGGRRSRIMVTLPTEAATDSSLIAALLARQVECLRINCAHDHPDVWVQMLDNLRRTERTVQRRAPVKVLMDLAGPKCRTGKVLVADHHQRLKRGDRLLLTRGEPASDVEAPAQVRCTLAEALDQLKPGAQVWIDDGKLGTRVETVDRSGAWLTVTHARAKGEKLKPDKGVNFPDTALAISPLTSKDREDLDFVARHADLIGYSFVQEATDVARLQEELEARLGSGWQRRPLVAKIETAKAVHNLPAIIIQAAAHQPFGAMIARGDLAVEVGYQRLSEIQEELLWLCEAALAPVIWATQVLEQLAKKGIPSRAEMTDAAMAQRSECVMLNKGPYIDEAVAVLDDVLTRMQTHQLKKTPQLRALHAWDDWIAPFRPVVT